MNTTPLTFDRFSELESHSPVQGDVDEAYLDTHRTITRWLTIGPVHSPKEFRRVAYDFEGPDGIFGDEHQVARVHYAQESGCWRWQVHCVRGHRSGLSREETDSSVIPAIALSLACGHLDLAMAHDRFFLGTVSEEARKEPVVQTLSHSSLPQKLLPWNRYFSKSARRDQECYYRCWARLKTARVPQNFGFRAGSRPRAVELLHRLGSKQGATVISKSVKGVTGWHWHVFDGKNELSGVSKSRSAGFKKASSALKKIGVTERYVYPVILDLKNRVQQREVLQ